MTGRKRSVLRVCVALLGLMAAEPAMAAAGITVTADQTLRFGTFAVAGSGTRTVGASGTTSNTNVYPVSGSTSGPAQFTIAYERLIQTGLPINVTVQITIAPVSSVTQNGVTGSISQFTTDLPGNASVTAGQAFTYTIANCTTFICQQSFRIGASLNVSQSTAGATLTAPLSVTATIVTVL